MSSYLKFQVQFHTQLNQTIRIVGNIKELGEWDPIKGLQLFTNAQLYPDWTHDTFIEIPRGTVLEFKCVKYEGDRLVKWENFQIDMNRKYKTQYYKAMLFMKEDNIQVIERPFQKYTGNHDYDIIDGTDARRIQDKFIVFDPLRKADGLSSSSDNSSLDFFRRQSKISDDFNVIENQIDYQRNENGIIVVDARKIRQKSDDEEDFNSDDIQNNHDNFEDVHLEKIIDAHQKIGEGGHQEDNRKLRGAGLGIKFNQSSLNQIQNNIPINLENIFLLFNRVKKESHIFKEKYPTIRKIVDLKDINLINQNQLLQMQNQNSQQSSGNDSDSAFKNIKNMRNVKSMPYINTQLQDKTEKTMIVVSYRLPYFVKNKKKKSSRMSTDIQISQMYDFTENFDPLIDSIYQSISNVKLNLIWVGICNIYVESESDKEDLREYMLKKYRCYPLFYKEDINQMFSRQFCSKFLYPQTENIMFYEEEKCWKVYKDINKDVANVLKKFTNESASIFAIVIYDFHFFLVPSYFQKQKSHSPGHLQQFDMSDKITIAFFMNRKFPQLQILEMLPQSDIFMHSLFFCDIMSFSTYESCESFLSLSQKMGCAVLHKAGGKIMLQCNGREILIRIEHPGINLKKLQITKDLIQKQVEEMTLILSEQNKHQLIGIDSISRNSGLEYKFRAFEKFLNKEKQNQSRQEYKLKQIVYFSTDSEFQTSQEQQDYLNEVKSLARTINQSQSFYDSAIEIIEGDSLSFEDYYQYLSISEVFLSTVLQETRHFHYMEYLFLKKDGQLILSNCLNQISQFSAVNIINPQDQPKIVSTLSKIFQNLAKNKKMFKEQIKLDALQSQSQIYTNQPSISLKKEKDAFNTSQQLVYSLDADERKKIASDCNNSDANNINSQSGQIIQDKIRINITEKNNTSEQAQREFDYNYLIKFCSSQNWINHFISDIVKRQSVSKNTCIFISTEEKTVVLDKQTNNIHKEIISKIYERSSQQYIEINLQNLIYRCKNAKNAVFIFGFSSVFFDHPTNLLSEPKPNPLLFKQVEELSKQPNVQIYIISGKSPELLNKYFGHIKNIILIANNGFKIQQTGSDLDFYQLTSKYEHTLWKMQVQTKMENFVQKTAGSYIVDSELQTSWHFENVEKEFADAQKNELIKQLVQIVENMPGNEIFEGYDFIQVRPQCLNKGVMTKIAIQNSCLLKNKKIDFLVVVGGRKTTDEEMLKSARDTIYDENVSYIESNSPAILGSISSQLGALYCNHQFENNQELAILLEMMNGNKQLLKTDQFANINPSQSQGNPQKFPHLNNHHNGNLPPPLVRLHTMCENNVEILNEKLKIQNMVEDENDQSNIQQFLDSDSKQSPLFIGNNYFLNKNNQIYQQKRRVMPELKIPSSVSQQQFTKNII